MIKFHSYKLISQGICSHCNTEGLQWVNNRGWYCPRCHFMYLIDKSRKCVIEPDCQSEK